MKKMFTLLVGLLTFSALFAQYDKSYDNRNYNNRNDSYGNRNSNDNEAFTRPDHAVEIYKDGGRHQQDDRYYKDENRRAEMDNINRDYDRRIDGYRNNHNMNGWKRNREIDRLQRERNERLKAFGGGVLLGGLLGVLIGSR